MRVQSATSLATLLLVATLTTAENSLPEKGNTSPVLARNPQWTGPSWGSGSPWTAGGYGPGVGGGSGGNSGSTSTGGSGNGSGSGSGSEGGSEGGASNTGAGANSPATSLFGLSSEVIRKVLTYRNAHGIIMALVMLILFPLGAILMRFFGKWWLHAAFQILTTITLIAGFATGIILAKWRRMLFNNAHTIIGTVLFAGFISLQPILGVMQHMNFKKKQRRGLVGYAHIWMGRSLILLGVVNGGLGIQLVGNATAESDSTRQWSITYVAVAAAMGVVYCLVILATAIMSRRIKEPNKMSIARL